MSSYKTYIEIINGVCEWLSIVREIDEVVGDSVSAILEERLWDKKQSVFENS